MYRLGGHPAMTALVSCVQFLRLRRTRTAASSMRTAPSTTNVYCDNGLRSVLCNILDVVVQYTCSNCSSMEHGDEGQKKGGKGRISEDHSTPEGAGAGAD